MPTIHDLPPETIEHIISIAYPVDPLSFGLQRARRHFLLDASLVHRDWTPFAQAALWTVLSLNRLSIQPVIESEAAGRYTTEELRVDLARRLNTSLEGLLEPTKGIRDLSVRQSYLDASWICGDNVRDLKCLELLETRVTCQGTPNFPFALTRLRLDSIDLIPDQVLVALSRQVSITFLGLEFVGDVGKALDALSPLAPQLTFLTLYYDLESVTLESARAVDHFLQRCTRLKDLCCLPWTAYALVHLTEPLDSCTLVLCGQSSMDEALDMLNLTAVAISKLQSLTVHFDEGDSLSDAVYEVESLERWEELEELCRERKTELSVGWRQQTHVMVPSP